ncbi:UNVERIFIED_CONTAM: helix-turn-helix domain-containing protein [Streptococcus canis]|nr:hypothetical protein [Streptococcus canis]
MTHAHLTTNELVMIEASVEKDTSVLEIGQSLKRSRQTIHKVVTFLKQGHSAN